MTTQIALGCMAMSGTYGAVDEAEAITTIRMALDRGIALVDTGDFYASGHNEILVGRAIRGRSSDVKLSVKFGALRGPDGKHVGVDARPASVKNFCAYSLQRLGVDVIDVYRPARLDPSVPIEDTMGAIAELIQAGYVKHAGLSEMGAETVKRAHKITPIHDVQIEYSIASRKPEENLFPTLRELGVSSTIYGVFSRGLLTGSQLGKGDFRANMPRFTGENAQKNADAAVKVKAFADKRGITAGQALIGYVLAKQPGFIPVVGAKNRKQLEDAFAAKPLSSDDVKELEKLVPPESIAGTRYAPEQMKHLDSER